MSTLETYVVHSDAGFRRWEAENEEHAQEQHEDAFPDERVIDIRKESATAEP